MKLDYKHVHYEYMKEVKMICNYILKELEDMKKSYNIKVILFLMKRL